MLADEGMQGPGGRVKVELTRAQVFALLYALDLWLDGETNKSRLVKTGERAQERLRAAYRKRVTSVFTSLRDSSIM